MLNRKTIEQIAKGLANAVPSDFEACRLELEETFRLFLNARFNELNLVTREEFEVQSQVLAKTRAKLENLEQQLSTMEATFRTQTHGGIQNL